MLQWLCRFFFHFQVAVCGVILSKKRVQPLHMHVIQRNCSNALSYIIVLYLFSLKNELFGLRLEIYSARDFLGKCIILGSMF